MATSSQGLTFSFDSATLSVTSVSVNDNTDLLDATDLSVATGGSRVYVNGFAVDREVSIDYLSNTILTAGASGSLSISGPLTFSGNATISSSSIGASVGDLVRGTATFRVATVPNP